jgi:hypothetical protein
MTKIAVKLAELRQRVAELEARARRQRQRAPSPRGAGDPRTPGGETVATLEKRLASLRRSCEILARHLAPRVGPSLADASRRALRPEHQPHI